MLCLAYERKESKKKKEKKLKVGWFLNCLVKKKVKEKNINTYIKYMNILH